MADDAAVLHATEEIIVAYLCSLTNRRKEDMFSALCSDRKRQKWTVQNVRSPRVPTPPYTRPGRPSTHNEAVSPWRPWSNPLGTLARSTIYSLQNRPEQIGNEEATRPDERRAPENDTTQLADYAARCRIVRLASFTLSKSRSNDIGHGKACRNQRSCDAERPNLVAGKTHQPRSCREQRRNRSSQSEEDKDRRKRTANQSAERAEQREIVEQGRLLYPAL